MQTAHPAHYHNLMSDKDQRLHVLTSACPTAQVDPGYIKIGKHLIFLNLANLFGLILFNVIHFTSTLELVTVTIC